MPLSRSERRGVGRLIPRWSRGCISTSASGWRPSVVGRRVNTLGTGEDGLRQQLALFQTYHHFAVPHASVRPMATGWTDHVGSLTAVLLLRGPPWPQPQALGRIAGKMIVAL